MKLTFFFHYSHSATNHINVKNEHKISYGNRIVQYIPFLSLKNTMQYGVLPHLELAHKCTRSN